MFDGGGDKGLLHIAGRSMLAHVVARVGPQVCALIVNANGDPARFATLDLPVVADPVEGFVGPLAGVLAGLTWTAAHCPGATHTLTVPSDTPFLPLDLASRLAAAVRTPTDVVLAATSDGMHPVAGLWPVALAEDVRRSLREGLRQVRAWTDRHGARRVHFDAIAIGGVAIDPFFNVNTPEDLAVARRLFGDI
jgi:molybdopterin-guanine dinucleotide biosynthesis protein A